MTFRDASRGAGKLLPTETAVGLWWTPISSSWRYDSDNNGDDDDGNVDDNGNDDDNDDSDITIILAYIFHGILTVENKTTQGTSYKEVRSTTSPILNFRVSYE